MLAPTTGWEDQVRGEGESTRNRCGLRRRAAQEGPKEAKVRRGKSFAHAARQVVARVWCKSSLVPVHGNHTAAYRCA